jgi:hypothetical protein
LLMTATWILIPSCAQVESSAAVIWKPPSPTMTQTSSFGTRELGADGRGEREAHRSEAARGDELSREVVLVVLRLPHLMLADVGHDERLALGDAPEIVHDVRGEEAVGVRHRLDVAHGRVALELVDRASHAWRSRGDTAGRARRASRRRRRRWARRPDVLVDLGGVELAVDLLRVRRVRLELPRDAVVEAHPQRDDEIRLLDGVVDPRLAVHPHHAEAERVGRGKARRARATWRRPESRLVDELAQQAARLAAMIP